MHDLIRLLEKGLRVFPGLALYDGTWEQPDEVVHYWERKYGLVRLLGEQKQTRIRL